MLSTRLLQLIEDHSEEIAKSVLESIRRDRLLSRFSKLPDAELLTRFEDVCKKISVWLAESNEEQLAKHFEKLGWLRYAEEIPLHEVVRAAHVFKEQLTRYAREHCYEQTALELYAGGELERLINSFFDKTVYYIVRAYGQALVHASKTAV